MPGLSALLALVNARVAVGAGVLAYCLLRLLVKRFHERGRTKILTIVILLSALLFTGNELRWAVFEGQLADAVRPGMGGAQPAFTCERPLRWVSIGPDTAGHVDDVGNDAVLSSAECTNVKAWQGHPAGASLTEIASVHTVTHEAAHMAGIRDEAKAECAAMQRDVATMTSLGATRSEAVRQVKTYWTSGYPRMPDNYRSDQCRSGGAMDLTPRDGTWP